LDTLALDGSPTLTLPSTDQSFNRSYFSDGFLCNKASEDPIPISALLNVHTCDRHWTWSWLISSLMFVGGSVLLAFGFPESGLWSQTKIAVVIVAFPWTVYQFVQSLRTRRALVAARANTNASLRCQGGESISPDRHIDRANH
jgi:hypothetical protein